MVYTDVENTTLVLVGLHGVAQTASDRRRTTMIVRSMKRSLDS
jgi:hypothetical protein